MSCCCCVTAAAAFVVVLWILTRIQFIYDVVVGIRNACLNTGYLYVVKPVFFLMDPETCHSLVSVCGNTVGPYAIFRYLTALVFSYSHPMLEQTVEGIRFKNPIGMAAGFDKNAKVVHFLPSLGFGHEEVGSVTGRAYEGNPRPRVWRFPNSGGLVIWYGLMNKGCDEIRKVLWERLTPNPVGISVAATNCEEVASDLKCGVEDFVKGYTTLVDCATCDYITLNISCPNSFGGLKYTDPVRLSSLLDGISEVIPQHAKRPIFLKMSPDLTESDLDGILEVVAKYPFVKGFISCNLTKNRDNENYRNTLHEKDRTHDPQKGGVSGSFVRDLALAQVRYLYSKTKGKYTIIGCGGIFTAEHCYDFIKNGATMVQLITACIFYGPQAVSHINHGLVKLLKQDGYNNISEAIGANFKDTEKATPQN